MTPHFEMAPDPSYLEGPPDGAKPIIVVGAGGIVRDAHLPAYRKAGFPVHGIVNRTVSRARELADTFGVANVYGTIEEAVEAAPPDAVYDLALMPEQYAHVLESLPDGAGVLIQKPLGHGLDDAIALREITRRKSLVAAVNTQLRFAPYVREARRLIAGGEIGELIDIEIRVSVDTHWELFPHVFELDRLEFTMHSVHYIDLIRSFVGDPESVSAVTVPHPDKALASTRSMVIMHYPERPLRAVVSTNHDNVFGAEHEASSITWQGTTGAIRAQMGLLLDYPAGGADRLQIARTTGGGWRDVPFEGSWFPDAFIGSMAALQSVVIDPSKHLATSVDDVVVTMAAVESAYLGSDRGGVRLPRL